MVVVDTLSKVAHFIPLQSTYKIVQIVDIFMCEIFRLHEIIIICGRGAKFTSTFWKTLFTDLSTQV